MARRALGPAQLAVQQAVRPHLDGLERVRVGLSGGADSLALTAAVAQLAPSVGVAAEAVVVDHGLQPGSSELAGRVADQARGLGIQSRVAAVEVRRTGDGLEADARTARLAALSADGGTVLLGHTLDDQAESVLLGLGRGSGSASLQGIASVREWQGARLVRPLLQLRRATTRQACDEAGLEPWDDPMNHDPAFARVRVRHELLPLMDEILGGGVVAALGRTAEMLQDDTALLDELAAEALVACRTGEGLAVAALASQPPALASRVLRGWLLEQGVHQPTHQHVLAALELVHHWHGQQGVDLPGGVRIRRGDGVLWAQRPPARG